MNARLGLEHDETLRVLTRDDIMSVLTTLVELKDGKGDIDDIDHSGQPARALGRRAAWRTSTAWACCAWNARSASA